MGIKGQLMLDDLEIHILKETRSRYCGHVRRDIEIRNGHIRGTVHVRRCGDVP